MDATTEDERLLIEAAQADPARFVELYDRHVDRIYAYVSRRTGSRVVAEDLTSAVFEQALASLPRFEWRGVPFAAWLLRIAANALVDHKLKVEELDPGKFDFEPGWFSRAVGRLPGVGTPVKR